MTFNDLKLSAPLLKAVSEAGYETPSPIQASAIPPVLEGRDLMGCAQTGTGKTAAFALPMLDRLSAAAPRKKGAVRALILTPTRELALQIGESFDAYGKYLKLRSTVIFGGVGQAPQVEAIRKGVDILIACPGRLNDLIGQGHIDLSNLEVFVLDEADRMLDMGFVHDVKKVIAKLPAKRQNLMFSATMPKEIEQLAAGILHDPAFVKVDPVSSTVERIDQSLYFVEKGNKKFLLPWLIKNLTPPVQNALVFSRTKHGADKIARDLTKQGITAAAIHGNKSQTARVAALEGFKEGKTRVLVATDIAARGIDISELSHVFNYDLPEGLTYAYDDPDQKLHQYVLITDREGNVLMREDGCTASSLASYRGGFADWLDLSWFRGSDWGITREALYNVTTGELLTGEDDSAVSACGVGVACLQSRQDSRSVLYDLNGGEAVELGRFDRGVSTYTPGCVVLSGSDDPDSPYTLIDLASGESIGVQRRDTDYRSGNVAVLTTDNILKVYDHGNHESAQASASG